MTIEHLPARTVFCAGKTAANKTDTNPPFVELTSVGMEPNDRWTGGWMDRRVDGWTGDMTDEEKYSCEE